MALQKSFEKQGICLFRYRGVIPIVILLIGAALYELCCEMNCLLSGPAGLAFRAYSVVRQ